MQLRQRDTTKTHTHGAPRRRQAPLRDAAAAAQARAEALADERRLRDSGGPDDRALYRCSCGASFRADVTTSVSCPRCGSPQAW